VPLPEPTTYPDLPWSLDGRILFALRELLLADAPLRTVLVRDDQVAILEMATLLRVESLPAVPCLALAVLADEEAETMSGYASRFDTVVQLALATAAPARWGDTQELLRSRVVAQIRRILRRDAGVLRGPDDEPLTEAVTRIQQVRLDATPLPSGLLLTLINATYRSSIDSGTQEFLP
jgi:hypothetical protein